MLSDQVSAGGGRIGSGVGTESRRVEMQCTQWQSKSGGASRCQRRGRGKMLLIVERYVSMSSNIVRGRICCRMNVAQMPDQINLRV